MQIERLLFFIDEFKNDQTISRQINSFNTYQLLNENWFDLNQNQLTDTPTIKRLNTSLTKKTIWRPQKSNRCYINLHDYKTILEVVFPSSPIQKTQNSFMKLIEKCLKHSNDSFEACHDAHTGLINKTNFTKKTLTIINNVSVSNQSQLNVDSILAVLALDIDHFKQTNDTYGHLYGDIVLKIFSQRLKMVEKEILKKFPNINIVVSRTGGEEFNIMLNGNFSDKDLIEIAEKFRLSIANYSLPDEKELEEYNDKIGTTVPHIADRHITASIGVSSVGLNTGETLNKEDLLTDLIRQADVALYKAKANGRNTVCLFKDIINKYGRILEHHTDTGIITIDIGMQVGLNRGQEFLVFHPDFTGLTPFIFNDGRTKKKIGTYPKHPTGKILVIEVQPEISFCVDVDNTKNNNYQVGSVLEAIPLGSISHILNSENYLYNLNMQDVRLVQPESIQSHIEKFNKQENSPIVIVYRILNLSKLLSEMGTAFINQSLAKLYKVIQTKYPDNALISQLQNTEFAVILNNYDNYDEIITIIKDTLDYLITEYNKNLQFVAGVYIPDYKFTFKGDASILDPNKALDYARYAVSDEGLNPEEQIEIFTPSTALRILSSWKRKRSFEQAFVDYKKLKDLGIKFASFENMASSCAYDNNDIDSAIVYINCAIDLDNDDPMLHANSAILAHLKGDIDTAFNEFQTSFTLRTNFVLSKHYQVVYVFILCKKFVIDKNVFERDNLIKLINDVKSNDKNFPSFYITKTLFDDSVKDIIN